MVLKESQVISGGTHDGKFDSSFVMLSANLDLSNILIRNPTFEAPHEQYTEDVMQRITSGLLIEGDLSCNSNLFIEKDVNIRGQLTVEQYQNENIITTTTSNYSFLTVAEDMSLNGRLFVRDDVSLNGSVYIDNSLGIATHRPVVAFDVSTVDAIKIPRGSTADRPETVDYEQRGYIRYNTDTSQFEGYGPGNSWISLGGAVDVDQDTFISAERGAGTDNDQLHFFTASGDTINVPHLRAVIDGSGLTIGSQLCEDVSNNVLTPTDPGFPGPRPPQDGLWVQGDASFNTHVRAEDMSVNMLKVKDASINRLGVMSDSSFNGHISATDVSINTLEVQDMSSTGILYVTTLQSTNRTTKRIDFGDSLVPYGSITGFPAATTNVESVPIGGVIMWANAALIPFGFYICDGGQTTSSNPTGQTSFEAPQGTITIPDLRGKFVAGYDSTSSLFNTVGNTGGSTQIGATQLPSHQHAGSVDAESFIAGAITGTISSQDTSHTHSFSGTTNQALHSNTNSTATFTTSTVTGHKVESGGSHAHDIKGYGGNDTNWNNAHAMLNMVTDDSSSSEFTTTSDTSTHTGHQHTIPDHDHTVDITAHDHYYSGTTGDQSASHSHTFTSADGTGSHTHTFTTGTAYGNSTIVNGVTQQDDYYQPYYTLLYIIRYTTPLDTANQVYGKELYTVPRQLAIGPNAFAELALDMRDCSDGILFPRGTQAQRPNFSDSTIYPNLTSLQSVTGTMRYNTDVGKFEGYAGLSGKEKWGSIGGGVLDEDEDTYIIAETSQGADNDQLQFFTANTERMRIDEHGNVGIGTTSPSTQLHILGDGPVMFSSASTINSGSINTVGAKIIINNRTVAEQYPSTDETKSHGKIIWTGYDRAAPSAYIESASDSWDDAGDIRFGVSNGSGGAVENMRIDTLGNLGIGTTSPGQKLDVNGTVQATSFNATSDLRLKENITPLTNSLTKINNLYGANFTWKNDKNKKMIAGLIAQDVEKIIPEVVVTNEHENEEGFHQKSINYDGLIPYLIESIKTLFNDKENMQQEIDNLKNENEALKEKMKQYDLWFAQLLNK